MRQSLRSLGSGRRLAIGTAKKREEFCRLSACTLHRIRTCASHGAYLDRHAFVALHLWALICLWQLGCADVSAAAAAAAVGGLSVAGLLAWWTWLQIPSCMSYNYANASQVWLPGAGGSHPCPILAWIPLAVSPFAASRLYTNELTPVVG